MNWKNKLSQRKKELEEQIQSLNESSKPVDLGESMGRLSRMDAIAHQQLALSNKKRLETDLKLIEQAFDRLQNDEFGYCLNCGNEISTNRLQAKPETTLCLECMEERT